MIRLAALIAASVAALGRCERLWLAYSGGLDSQVLLHVVAGLRAQLPPIQAVHIHHGLSAHADAWQRHCEHVCKTLDVPLVVKPVHIVRQRGESLEALARQARYTALQACLGAGDVLVTAHHADDQAETLLLQLLRGAGPAGLAAMPAVSRLGAGRLLRPWLEVARAELQDYGAAEKLSWIDDESNQDLRFERNFIRHQIFPLLKQRRAGVTQALVRAAAHQGEATQLLSELGEIDLAAVRGHALPAFYRVPLDAAAPRLRTAACPPLSLAALQTLSPARQTNVLRTWLKSCGLRVPNSLRVQVLLQQAVSAGEDRQPLLRWDAGEIHRYQGQLHAMPPLPSPPATALPWHGEDWLALPLGRLCACPVQGQGLRLPSDVTVDVRFRQGGETLRVNGCRQKLKKHLQKCTIPPWQRNFLPLLYVDDELAAVPGIVVGDGFSMREGGSGWCFTWEPDWF